MDAQRAVDIMTSAALLMFSETQPLTRRSYLNRVASSQELKEVLEYLTQTDTLDRTHEQIQTSHVIVEILPEACKLHCATKTELCGPTFKFRLQRALAEYNELELREIGPELCHGFEQIAVTLSRYQLGDRSSNEIGVG